MRFVFFTFITVLSFGMSVMAQTPPVPSTPPVLQTLPSLSEPAPASLPTPLPAPVSTSTSTAPDFSEFEKQLQESFQERTDSVNIEAKQTPTPAPEEVKETVPQVPVIKETKLYIDDNVINIATGSITGVYYPLGSAICRLLNRDNQSNKLRCGVESTEGSVQNVSALRQAEADFAIIQSDWLEHAYKGTSVFTNAKAYQDLRFVFSFYVEAMTFLARSDTRIIALDDFKGKIINIGQEGSGVRATLFEMFKAKNWTKNDFKSFMQLNPMEQVESLCNGNLDIMVLATGHPNGIVQEATKSCNAKIVGVVDPAISTLINGNNEYATAIIPGGLYFGNPNDKQTFGVTATLVTTTDMSVETVYKLTKAVFENLEEFKRLHPVFVNLNPQSMVKNGMTAPMHDGAKKYFIERGLIQ